MVAAAENVRGVLVGQCLGSVRLCLFRGVVGPGLPRLRLLELSGGGLEGGGGESRGLGSQFPGLLGGGVESSGQRGGCVGDRFGGRRGGAGARGGSGRGLGPGLGFPGARVGAGDVGGSDVAAAGAAGRRMAGRVGDGHGVVVAVGESVGTAAGGGGVLAGEAAGGGGVEAGAHVDLGGGRVGPLALVADLDRRAAGAEHLTPRVVGGGAGQAGAGGGEQTGEVVVLVDQGEGPAAGGGVHPDEAARRVAGVGGGGVGGDLPGGALVGEADAGAIGLGGGHHPVQRIP